MPSTTDTSKAALTFLAGYQTPASLQRIGQSRLPAWLANRKVRNASAVAAAAIEAANLQHTRPPQTPARP